MMVSATNISAQTGSASPIHCANGMVSPVASSISARPIRFGGLPTGVSRPPTLAPYASINMIATPTRSLVGSKSETSSPASIRWSWIRLAITARIPIAVGNSMATVAVLETNAEITQVIRPKAMITREVLLPTPGSARMRNANLRASPCLSIDWARMNAPMKVKMVAGAERREHLVGVCPDPQQDQQRRADESGNRDRDRLGDPHDDDGEQDRRHRLLFLGQVQRQEVEDDAGDRSQDVPDVAAPALEALLTLGEALLAEALVRRAAEESLLDVDAFACGRRARLIAAGRGHDFSQVAGPPRSRPLWRQSQS